MLEIKIETSGSAYLDENESLDRNATELCRNLKEIEKKLKNGYDSGIVMDINGNKVGEWSLTKF